MTVLLIVAASAAGWLILVASLAVLYAMHPTTSGRWMTASGWSLTAFAGLWFAVVPSVNLSAPPWPVVALAASFATIAWRNLPELCHQAALPSRYGRFLPLAGLGLLAGCMVVLPAMALQVNGNVVTLTPEEAANCANEGGCVFMSRKRLTKEIDEAARRLQDCFTHES